MVNLNKISRSIPPSAIIGGTLVSFKIRGTDSPFFTIDEMNKATVANRTLGTAFTTTISSSSEYRIPQQKVFTIFTVGSTGTKTIAYGNTIDLSSGFFNGFYEPVLAFAISFKKGATVANTALTVAERTIKIKMTDQDTVEFGNGSTQDVDEFDYIIGENTTSNLSLDGKSYIVSVPLSKLSSSATKKFLSTSFEFALPEGAEFAVYKIGVYRDPSDCLLIDKPAIQVTTPLNLTDNNSGESFRTVQGPNQEALAILPNAVSQSMSFEGVVWNPRHGLQVLGDEITDAGYVMENSTITIASGNMTVGALQGVESATPVYVSIEQDDGTYVDARVVEGGNYIAENEVRFIRETGSLRFNSTQVGKKASIRVFKQSSDAVTVSSAAIQKQFYADVYMVYTDTTNPDESQRQIVKEINNCVVTANLVATGIDNDAVAKIQFSMTQLVSDVTAKTVKTSFSV